MGHGNREILSAVLAYWLEPMAAGLLSGNILQNMPAVQAIDNKIRSTGWVSPKWSVASELEPLIGGAASALLQPFIAGLLANVQDEAIPEVAHGIVDKAVDMGELALFEGKVTFEGGDLRRLQHLLEVNLPTEGRSGYIVKE